MLFDMSRFMPWMETFFFLYFFTKIESITLPSFSFTEADFATWHCKSCIVVKWILQNGIENEFSPEGESSCHVIACHEYACKSAISCTSIRAIQGDEKVKIEGVIDRKCTRKPCAFLRNLIEIWCVIWHVSAGIVLGVLRKRKKIFLF